MKIWVLKDEKIGSSKQSEFLARSLDNDITIKNIVYTSLVGIPNKIKPYKCGINFHKSDDLTYDTEIPDIIIFAGRRLAGLAIYLKHLFQKKNNKNVKLIAILNPRYSFKHFDYIILPSHDNVKNNRYNNIITIDGSLCGQQIDIDKSEKEYWNPLLEKCKKPFFTWIIGGDTKRKKMNPENIGLITRKISKFVEDEDGTLLVTTSRRTSYSCLKEIERNILCNNCFYDWNNNYNVPNPYNTFITAGEIEFITGDSISMISEITTLGKPTYLYIPTESLKKKHLRFCDSIIKRGSARDINIDTENFEKFVINNKMNELDRIAIKIKKDIEIDDNNL